MYIPTFINTDFLIYETIFEYNFSKLSASSGTGIVHVGFVECLEQTFISRKILALNRKLVLKEMRDE